MINETDEFRNWAGPLKKEEVKEINLLVINKVIEACDDTPFRKFNPRKDGDWTAREHRPDLRSKRLFPSNGLREANRVATDLDKAAVERSDLGSLRMLTLRLKDERPAFGGLDEHLRKLSLAASKVADDIQRPTKKHPGGLAGPILTSIHIRVTDEGTGQFDPHVHGIWHIADLDIKTVKERLGEKFGQVWIDSEPVRSLKRAAFYIVQGIIDYRGLPAWPDTAIRAAWGIQKVKMFRKAGWFASEGKPDELMPDDDQLGPDTVQDAPVGHVRDRNEPDPVEVAIVPQEGILGGQFGADGTACRERPAFPIHATLSPIRVRTRLHSSPSIVRTY